MSNIKDVQQIQSLIAKGKGTGFLTFDEVNKALPVEMSTPEQFEEIIGIFEQLEIVIVDSEKDGKKIYQAKFTKIPITEKDTSVLFRKLTEEEVVQRLNCEIAFKITPHYSGEDTPEVMLTVYPYENLLTGSAVEWLKVTSDRDYFIHKFSKGEKSLK